MAFPGLPRPEREEEAQASLAGLRRPESGLFWPISVDHPGLWKLQIRKGNLSGLEASVQIRGFPRPLTFEKQFLKLFILVVGETINYQYLSPF